MICLIDMQVTPKDSYVNPLTTYGNLDKLKQGVPVCFTLRATSTCNTLLNCSAR